MNTLTGILLLIITFFSYRSDMDALAQALLVTLTLVFGIILLFNGLLPLFTILH